MNKTILTEKKRTHEAKIGTITSVSYQRCLKKELGGRLSGE